MDRRGADAGEAVPPRLRWNAVRDNPDYAGWILSVVAIDLAALDDTAERVNITLPRRVLRRLDEDARAAGETRSGYIAKLALGALADALTYRHSHGFRPPPGRADTRSYRAKRSSGRGRAPRPR